MANAARTISFRTGVRVLRTDGPPTRGRAISPSTSMIWRPGGECPAWPGDVPQPDLVIRAVGGERPAVRASGSRLPLATRTGAISPARRADSDPVALAGFHTDCERRPLRWRDREIRPVRVLGVPHRDHAGQVQRDLHARAAIAAAVAALAPSGAGYAVHRSSATFPIRSREAPLGRASARRRSNARAALLTSAGFSIVWPSTAVSAYRILGAVSKPATMKAPSKPA